MGSGISVSGGAGGIGARLDDMRTAAAALQSMASDLLDRANSTAAYAADPDLLSSAVLSPVTAAAAEEKIISATGQLVIFATQTGVSAVFLSGAVDTYEALDQALAAMLNVGTNAATFVAGALVIPAAIAGGLLVLGDVAGAYVAGYTQELVESIGNAARLELQNPWIAQGGLLGFAALISASFDVKDLNANAQGILGAQLKQLQQLAADHAQELNEFLGQNAGFVDFITRGAPGLLAGLVAPLGIVLGPLFYPAMNQITGVTWPPLTYEQAVQALVGAGNKAGMLDDGGPITEADLFDPPSIHDPLAPPHSLADLMAGSADIDTNDQLPIYSYGLVLSRQTYARIRIITIAGDPPHYIVQIPSTQDWSPTPGSTPNDLTSDTAAMMGRQTALASAVEAAMKKAKISSDAPVMLEGFSLGGITAGAMAADPSLHYNITHVVTAGSPIANFDIPDDVRVLSLEHTEDPVARLDGNANPDRANWVTVHADAPLMSGDKGVAPGITGAHDAVRYESTAMDATAAGDPSIDAWQASADDFFLGDSTVTDYGALR